MGESWTGYPGTEAEEQYEIRRSAKPGGTGYHDALRVIEILGLEVED